MSDNQLDTFLYLLLAYRKQNILPQVVVYTKPKDYPDHFVARLFEIGPGTVTPTPFVIIGESLDEVRNAIPTDNMIRLDRSAEDDSVITESWI